LQPKGIQEATLVDTQKLFVYVFGCQNSILEDLKELFVNPAGMIGKD